MEEGDTSITFLAVLDAAITESFDTFKFILQKLKCGEQYVGERELILQECAHTPRGSGTKSYYRIGKCGFIPDESAF